MKEYIIGKKKFSFMVARVTGENSGLQLKKMLEFIYKSVIYK